MNPTIVTLSPSVKPITVSYEEAFGEYSEARGRGRARRNKRKTERQQNRIARRGARKSARQKNRAAQQEARQSRKDVRKSRRVARKAMGEEPEVEPSETPSEDSGSGAPSGDGGSGSDTGGGSGSGGYSGGEENDGGYTGDGPAEGEYETTQDSDVQSGDEEVVDEEQGPSDEESGFTGELGFDGVIAMSPEDAQWNEYFSSAEGMASINKGVKKLSLLIEKEKDIISRLNKKIDELGKNNTPEANRNVAIFRKNLSNHNAKLNEMEIRLAGYCKFDGDYSEARGGRKNVAKRKAEVRRAKKEARRVRKQAIRNRKRGGDTTVDAGLKADFGNQRIEVEAEESNFYGTGLIGLDNQEDYDAPEVRKFDLKFSNADGDDAKKQKRKKMIIGVSIGVAVGVLAIVLIKKFGKK
jgi:hypothetical protein